MGCKLRTYWSIGWREIIGQNALIIFSWVRVFFPHQIKGNDSFNALCCLPYVSKEKPYMPVRAAVSPSVRLRYRLYISNIKTGSDRWPLGQLDGPCSACLERLWITRLPTWLQDSECQHLKYSALLFLSTSAMGFRGYQAQCRGAMEVSISSS